MQRRGLDHRGRNVGGVTRLQLDLDRLGVELPGDQDLVDDLGEPGGLALDHLQEGRLVLVAQVEILAPQRADCPVHRGERRPELMRGSRYELGARGLQRMLVGDIAERVHTSLAEVDARRRDPELPALDRERDGHGSRDGLARANERQVRDERFPGRQDGFDAQAESAFLGDTRDRGGRGVPVPDDAFAVEEDDPVGDVGERAGRVCTTLRLAEEGQRSLGAAVAARASA